MMNEYNEDNWASLQYIAYYNDSKNLICFSHNKKSVELYLMRLDIYDKATLFESTNVKFNMALFNVFEAFEITKWYTNHINKKRTSLCGTK